MMGATADPLTDARAIMADHLQRLAPDVPTIMQRAADETDPDWLTQAWAYFDGKRQVR